VPHPRFQSGANRVPSAPWRGGQLRTSATIIHPKYRRPGAEAPIPKQRIDDTTSWTSPTDGLYQCDLEEDFDPKLFQDKTTVPSCPECEKEEDSRAENGKRRRNPGFLKPDILLDGSLDNRFAGTISEDQAKDEASKPDVVVVAGTSLQSQGGKELAKGSVGWPEGKMVQ